MGVYIACLFGHISTSRLDSTRIYMDQTKPQVPSSLQVSAGPTCRNEHNRHDNRSVFVCTHSTPLKVPEFASLYTSQVKARGLSS